MIHIQVLGGLHCIPNLFTYDALILWACGRLDGRVEGARVGLTSADEYWHLVQNAKNGCTISLLVLPYLRTYHQHGRIRSDEVKPNE